MIPRYYFSHRAHNQTLSFSFTQTQTHTREYWIYNFLITRIYVSLTFFNFCTLWSQENTRTTMKLLLQKCIQDFCTTIRAVEQILSLLQRSGKTYFSQGIETNCWSFRLEIARLNCVAFYPSVFTSNINKNHAINLKGKQILLTS